MPNYIFLHMLKLKKKLNFTMQDSQMQSISTKLFFINVPFILEHK